MLATAAMMKFVVGPANAVIASADFGFFVALGLTGTGRAKPKPTSAIMSVPAGWRWASGLSVNRPLARGRPSPSRSAARACEAS